MKLETYKTVIKELLNDYPQLRGNDRKLYLAVLWKMGFPYENVTIVQFFNDNSYPNLESIRRCRQKVQEENPELLPPEKIQKMRDEMEKEYLEFARGNG